mmetsp:Transcript_35637/g.42925  ORF Transcript_35637/g.42925 Transcript_35637/m.42925 type:complete len:90 (+) Transcript_35637:168-437(+)|eukprot:CAMPEP_0197846952 /NCGR_PEP_ID=MMETSP1438-20131217/4736_1 /TAXON_ID=1461541 /ORGANISM="Pterosperma sp., Strain CCMP1384" /LENGTH=89 /DNA_ID=CAMNT_0043458743 /DNA_START=146 /DNA_END=415 /DNA_ORIENTATION=-
MASSVPAPPEVDKDRKFEMAKVEMEYRIDLFQRLTSSCFEKCMDHRFKDGDLNVGENSCVDRCAAKYWAVTSIVGQILGGPGGLGGPPQ